MLQHTLTWALAWPWRAWTFRGQMVGRPALFAPSSVVPFPGSWRAWGLFSGCASPAVSSFSAALCTAADKHVLGQGWHGTSFGTLPVLPAVAWALCSLSQPPRESWCHASSSHSHAVSSERVWGQSSCAWRVLLLHDHVPAWSVVS